VCRASGTVAHGEKGVLNFLYAGIESVKQFHVRVFIDGDKYVDAVVDLGYRTKSGYLVLEEIKAGPEAKLSANQKALFKAAWGAGRIEIVDAGAAKFLGVKPGQALAAQSAKLLVNLTSDVGGRAARQLIRIGTSPASRFFLGVLFTSPVSMGASLMLPENELNASDCVPPVCKYRH
jgi:hypothetical protein